MHSARFMVYYIADMSKSSVFKTAERD